MLLLLSGVGGMGPAVSVLASGAVSYARTHETSISFALIRTATAATVPTNAAGGALTTTSDGQATEH